MSDPVVMVFTVAVAALLLWRGDASFLFIVV